MTHQSEPIYKSVLGGQIVALQQAIQAIVMANRGCLQGVLDGVDLDDAINAAEDLLPPEMRDGDAVPTVKKDARARNDYEDLGI